MRDNEAESYDPNNFFIYYFQKIKTIIFLCLGPKNRNSFKF